MYQHRWNLWFLQIIYNYKWAMDATILSYKRPVKRESLPFCWRYWYIIISFNMKIIYVYCICIYFIKFPLNKRKNITSISGIYINRSNSFVGFKVLIELKESVCRCMFYWCSGVEPSYTSTIKLYSTRKPFS